MDTCKLRDLLPLLRGSAFDPRDEGTPIILKPECEEWTWVTINDASGFLDLLGDVEVYSIDAEEDSIVLWVQTESYNRFI